LLSQASLQAIDLDKDELVQAIALSAFVSTIALALGLGLNSGLSTAVVVPALVALCAALAGMAAGQLVRSKLSLEVFRRWVFVGLLVIGGTMVVRIVF
jgi:uncharacterized membrane protein YfcA